MGADILSVIIPLKDDRGLTSTGIFHDSEIRRFTMKEVYDLPETFCMSDLNRPGTLMVNTGLWICDFTQAWVEKVCFTILDYIEKNSEGIWEARSLSEDWNFSLNAERLGLKVYATRKVQVGHHGEACWDNMSVWGTLTEDIGDVG